MKKQIFLSFFILSTIIIEARSLDPIRRQDMVIVQQPQQLQPVAQPAQQNQENNLILALAHAFLERISLTHKRNDALKEMQTTYPIRIAKSTDTFAQMQAKYPQLSRSDIQALNRRRTTWITSNYPMLNTEVYSKVPQQSKLGISIQRECIEPAWRGCNTIKVQTDDQWAKKLFDRKSK